MSLLRAVGEGSVGAPAPSSSTRTSAPTGPYPTSWEDALNDILASVPSPLVSPIEKAAASTSPIEAVAHEYQYLEVKEVETRTTEESEEAVTPTTGQMLEISARERAVQTELDMLDDRYRTVVASRRRELLEATLAERDAVAEELARRQAVEAASAPNPATHVAPSPRPSPRSPARSPARPSPRSSPAKNAAEECPEHATRSTDPYTDERPPWTDRLAARSPTSAATPTSAARRTFLRRGTGNGGAPVTGNATPSPAAKERTSRTPATREDTLRHEFIASVERERERHRARSASRTPGSAGLSSRRRTSSSKSPARVRAPSHPTPDYSAVEPRYMSAAEAKSSAPWRGSPYTPSWRPNGYNNNRVDDHGSSPAEDAGARSVDTRTRTPPRRSVTPEPRRRAPPRATPVKQVDKKTPGVVRKATPGARKVNPNPKPSTPMRFGSTPEGKDGSTPSAAYVEAAENMRRSLKRLSAASEAADLILMRSTAAVVAADEEKKCADRGGLEATFIDAFRGAEKGDARRSPKAKASPEPANDFERQFLAAYRKYAATPSPVPAPKEEIVPSAWIPSMPPTPEASKPAPASPRVKSAPSSKKSPPTAAKVTRESTKPKPKPATSMEAARASLARLNAATNAKDGEYTPPSPQQQQPNVVEEPKAESPAVKLFSEKMSAPSPVKHRKPEPVETTKAPVNLVAVDSDSDDDPLLGLDENADIRRFLGTPGRRREESAPPLTSLGVNHNSPRPGGSKAPAEMQKPATVPVATSVPVAPALAPALDKDKRKREDREVEDFEALLSLDPSQPRPARKLSGGADANTAASTQRKPVHAKKPSAPLPVPTAAVPRIRGRSSLLTRPAVEPKLPASAATFQQKTRGLNAGSVLSRSRREYEDEKVARLKAEAEECTFSPRTIGTPAYLKKKRAGGGSGKKKEVRYAELPMRGSSAWR